MEVQQKPGKDKSQLLQTLPFQMQPPPGRPQAPPFADFCGILPDRGHVRNLRWTLFLSLFFGLVLDSILTHF